MGKDNLQIERKYSQIMYLIRDLYIEYICNYYNSTKKQQNFKEGT